MPWTGSQPRRSENSSTSIWANQNTGIDSRATAPPVTPWSSHRERDVPAVRPTAMPTTEPKMSAVDDSRNVGQTRLRITSSTASLFENE